jgi:hypothetical protein
LVDHAFGVGQDHVLVAHAHRLDELGAGDARRTRAVDHHLGRFDVAAREMDRVDQARRRDDRRAVLVVVEDRDVEQFAQALLDHEAFGRLDILEIDAAESDAQIAHAIDELVDVLGVDFQIDRIDVRETLEQNGLAFHHRLAAERAQIAQSQHRRAVGDHGHEIALGRVVVGRVGILGDVQARPRHAGRIGERQIARGGQRLGRIDLDLAGFAALLVEQQRILLGHGRRIVGHRSYCLFCRVSWKGPIVSPGPLVMGRYGTSNKTAPSKTRASTNCCIARDAA